MPNGSKHSAIWQQSLPLSLDPCSDSPSWLHIDTDHTNNRLYSSWPNIMYEYDDFATPLHHMVLKCEKCENSFTKMKFNIWLLFKNSVPNITLGFSYIHEKKIFFLSWQMHLWYSAYGFTQKCPLENNCAYFFSL